MQPLWINSLSFSVPPRIFPFPYFCFFKLHCMWGYSRAHLMSYSNSDISHLTKRVWTAEIVFSYFIHLQKCWKTTNRLMFISFCVPYYSQKYCQLDIKIKVWNPKQGLEIDCLWRTGSPYDPVCPEDSGLSLVSRTSCSKRSPITHKHVLL